VDLDHFAFRAEALALGGFWSPAARGDPSGGVLANRSTLLEADLVRDAGALRVVLRAADRARVGVEATARRQLARRPPPARAWASSCSSRHKRGVVAQPTLRSRTVAL